MLKRLAVIVALALAAAGFSASPSYASIQQGLKNATFSYPNFSGQTLQIASWYNLDTVNHAVRGYGTTDAPNIAGFRSSTLSEMRYCNSSICAYLQGQPRYYGNTELVTSFTNVMSCSSTSATYDNKNMWSTTDAYDYIYQGSLYSYSNFYQANCG